MIIEHNWPPGSFFAGFPDFDDSDRLCQRLIVLAPGRVLSADRRADLHGHRAEGLWSTLG